MKALLAAIAGVCLSASSVLADAPREYSVHRLAQAPTLDGKLDEAAWQTVPEATGFFVLGKSYAIEKQTSFRAGWTDDGLFLGIRCYEPTPERISAAIQDGGHTWLDDSVEFFFCLPGAAGYTQFGVTSTGARYNGTGSGAPQSIWDWQVKTDVGKDYWAAEIRMPFAVLGGRPDPGTTWRFNLARNITTGPDSEHFTCWPALKTGFHDLERFARLTFNASALPPEQAAAQGAKSNQTYCESLRGEILDLAKAYDACRQWVEKAAGTPAFTQKAEPIKTAWDSITRLAADPKPETAALAAVLSASRRLALIEKSDELRDLLLMETLFE